MLFTAGMTLLDSIDSILMLYSYTGFPEQRFRVFEPVQENDVPERDDSAYREAAATRVSAAEQPRSRSGDGNEGCPVAGAPPALGGQPEQSGSSEEDRKKHVVVAVVVADADERIREIRKKVQRELIVKRNMMSGLSIVLTLMSILVAFRCVFYPSSCAAFAQVDVMHCSISLITTMGLIGDNCARCRDAAGNDKGLAGRWWRFWAEVWRHTWT